MASGYEWQRTQEDRLATKGDVRKAEAPAGGPVRYRQRPEGRRHRNRDRFATSALAPQPRAGATKARVVAPARAVGAAAMTGAAWGALSAQSRARVVAEEMPVQQRRQVSSTIAEPALRVVPGLALIRASHGPMTPAFMTSASTDPLMPARPARTESRLATSMTTMSKMRRPVAASSSAFAVVALSRFRHAR